jgi:hypothetical protein
MEQDMGEPLNEVSCDKENEQLRPSRECADVQKGKSLEVAT